MSEIDKIAKATGMSEDFCVKWIQSGGQISGTNIDQAKLQQEVQEYMNLKTTTNTGFQKTTEQITTTKSNIQANTAQIGEMESTISNLQSKADSMRDVKQQCESGMSNVRGKLREAESSHNSLVEIYNNLSPEEKNGDYGKEVAAALSESNRTITSLQKEEESLDKQLKECVNERAMLMNSIADNKKVLDSAKAGKEKAIQSLQTLESQASGQKSQLDDIDRKLNELNGKISTLQQKASNQKCFKTVKDLETEGQRKYSNNYGTGSRWGTPDSKPTERTERTQSSSNIGWRSEWYQPQHNGKNFLKGEGF